MGKNVSWRDLTPVQLISQYDGKLTPTSAQIAKRYKIGKTAAQRKILAGMQSGEVVRHIEDSRIWYEVPSLGIATVPRSTKGLTKQSLEGGRGEQERLSFKVDWSGVDFSHMDVATKDGGVWPGNYPVFRAGYLGNGMD